MQDAFDFSAPEVSGETSAMLKVSERAAQLRALLDRYAYAYYVCDAPEVPMPNMTSYFVNWSRWRPPIQR